MSVNDEPTTYTVPVPAGKDGTRLDRLLAEALDDLSRTRLKALIEDGRVRRSGDDDPVDDPSCKVREGQSFVVEVPPAIAATPEPQPMDLNVVYEDENVIVIDKLAGLVVHPAPGSPDGTLVNALLAHCAGGLSGIGGVERPGIVHRLDKGTSGLMVVAKNDIAHRHLSEQFHDRTVERAYKALVWGVPSPGAGEIKGNIGRSPSNRKKMAVVKRGGKTALTRYKVLEKFGDVASLVECRLATGRTHQIRVHMAEIGHGVIGDPLYGRGSKSRLGSLSDEQRHAVESLNHQALHAYIIGFTPIPGADTLRYESAIHSDINCLLEFFAN
ncbi:MAG: RluA family pseudouridine synthase [Rhodospirillaceae bacterium]|jgi:23S rRNA pseudouridine1911/1915/1917 synthase|nr:RluA family pseudouridine synthase [Rhodospirillaceae bacterium]MBT4220374.1 RluA family pseudouridine synthase [Rhodospirillaceae bacterium]MBT4463171.1 RluA family pseudouridine synthase [Rhodospirillaceae bacterium]MBT5013553.1 RluA family pseudouridine synthase [Rhodospirillaceae bacterium]MBT5308768.1 RluA family pseudouridine synthase [Rhodospirillaceae bacterium]